MRNNISARDVAESGPTVFASGETTASPTTTASVTGGTTARLSRCCIRGVTLGRARERLFDRFDRRLGFLIRVLVMIVA